MPDSAAAPDIKHILDALKVANCASPLSVMAMLSQVPLTPTQRGLIEILDEFGRPPAAEPPPATSAGPEVGLTPEDADGAGDPARELAELREINAMLAAALGACTCWGQAGCPACGGAGRPGHAAPDRALFRALVVPALQRAQREQCAAAGRQGADGQAVAPARPARSRSRSAKRGQGGDDERTV